jgi:hypothetical protein
LISIPVLPNDVKLFQSTPERAKELWEKLRGFDRLFSDATSGDFVAFYRKITDPDAVILETDGGIMMLNNFDKDNNCAQVHASFWDKKLSQRKDLLKNCLVWSFLTCDLYRIGAYIPEYARALRRFLERKLNFSYEGRLRKRLWYKGNLVDVIALSILREEVL